MDKCFVSGFNKDFIISKQKSFVTNAIHRDGSGLQRFRLQARGSKDRCCSLSEALQADQSGMWSVKNFQYQNYPYYLIKSI